MISAKHLLIASRTRYARPLALAVEATGTHGKIVPVRNDKYKLEQKFGCPEFGWQVVIIFCIE